MTDGFDIEAEKQRRLDLLEQARAIIDGALQDMYRRLHMGKLHKVFDAACDGVNGACDYNSRSDLFGAMDESESSLLNATFDEWESQINSHFNTLAEAVADA